MACVATGATGGKGLGRAQRQSSGSRKGGEPQHNQRQGRQHQLSARHHSAAERQVAALQPVPPVVTTVPVVPTEIYIQAGAFQNVNNAVRLSAQLTEFGRATVAPKQIRNQLLYRVRFGPFTSVEDADRMLARMIGAGYPDARVVVDQ